MYTEAQKLQILTLYISGFTYEAIAARFGICKADTKNKRGAVHELLKRWGLLPAAKNMRKAYLKRLKRHTKYRTAYVNRSNPKVSHIEALYCTDHQFEEAVHLCAMSMKKDAIGIDPVEVAMAYKKIWLQKASNALSKNIPFSLDFDFFVGLARTHCIEPDDFGRESHEYVIGRLHHLGDAYSNDNVILQTKSSSSREAQIRNYHMKKQAKAEVPI